MNLPGFDAEASLGRTRDTYGSPKGRLTNGEYANRASVVPSLPISGCGACTELRWPTGGGTGACVRDCCDVLGRCQIETCPCSGSDLGGVSFHLERALFF